MNTVLDHLLAAFAFAALVLTAVLAFAAAWGGLQIISGSIPWGRKQKRAKNPRGFSGLRYNIAFAPGFEPRAKLPAGQILPPRVETCCRCGFQVTCDQPHRVYAWRYDPESHKWFCFNCGWTLFARIIAAVRYPRKVWLLATVRRKWFRLQKLKNRMTAASVL